MITDNPEQRLWAKVINQALADFDQSLTCLKKGLLRNNYYAVLKHYEYLSKLYYEISGEWFKDICEYVDLDNRRICNHLKNLIKELNIDQIELEKLIALRKMNAGNTRKSKDFHRLRQLKKVA